MTLVDPTDSLVTWIRADHASCSRHKAYALSCEQFDALLDRAEGRCELTAALYDYALKSLEIRKRRD